MRSGDNPEIYENTQYTAFSRTGLAILLLLITIGLIATLLVIFIAPEPRTVNPISEYAPINLTLEEQEWIHNHPVIRVCPDSSYPPFEWITKDGEYQGISAELLREICSITGLSLEIASESDWGVCIHRLQTGTADILGAVYISDLRDDYLIYSEPYYRSLLPIITRTSMAPSLTLEQLSGKRVAAVKGFTTSLLLKEKYPDIILVEVANVREGLEIVSLGTADAYFGDMAASSWYVNVSGISNLHVAGAYNPPDPDEFSYAFGVRKDYPELVRIINKGLYAIPPERREEIFRRWISPTLAKAQVNPIILMLITGAIGVLLIVTLIFILWNRTLQRVVREKTHELSIELAEGIKTAEILQLTRFTVDHSHAMILWLDTGGIIRDVNETVCHDTEYERGELIGNSISLLVTRLNETIIGDLLNRVKTEGRIRRETSITSHAGEDIPVEIILWYFTFEGSEWFCAEIWDISERLTRERSIKESEEQYRNLFHNVNDAIFLFAITESGLPGRILDANTVAELMTGYPHEELCSMPYVHLGVVAHPDIRTIDPQGCTTGRCTFEWDILNASAEIIPVEVNLHVFDRDGVQFGLSLIRDLTERKVFESERDAAINQIQKNMAELSVLNDGIRNPLTIILSTAEIYCSDGFDEIETQISRIDGVINQLDQRWNESEKILLYLKKHHGLIFRTEPLSTRETKD